MRKFLRWEVWLNGLGAAFIGGGASAITAAGGLAGAQAVGFHVQTLDMKSFFAVFISAGVFNACMFLKQSPLPPPPTGNTEQFTKPVEKP